MAVRFGFAAKTGSAVRPGGRTLRIAGLAQLVVTALALVGSGSIGWAEPQMTWKAQKSKKLNYCYISGSNEETEITIEWRDGVYDLLIEDSDFPTDMEESQTFPARLAIDDFEWKVKVEYMLDAMYWEDMQVEFIDYLKSGEEIDIRIAKIYRKYFYLTGSSKAVADFGRCVASLQQ